MFHLCPYKCRAQTPGAAPLGEATLGRALGKGVWVGELCRPLGLAHRSGSGLAVRFARGGLCFCKIPRGLSSFCLKRTGGHFSESGGTAGKLAQRGTYPGWGSLKLQPAPSSALPPAPSGVFCKGKEQCLEKKVSEQN